MAEPKVTEATEERATLLRNLRNWAVGSEPFASTLMNAAYTIDEQQREIERLRGDLSIAAEQRDGFEQDNEWLRKQRDEVLRLCDDFDVTGAVDVTLRLRRILEGEKR